MNKRNQKFAPMDAGKLFNSLVGKKTIVMATNTQIIPGVMEGIMQAAKDCNSYLIIELAKSECNFEGGYTGLTPDTFSQFAYDTAKKVELETWALHADHTTVKKLDEAEIQSCEKLLKAEIDAGYTSFAIDASFLFNVDAENIKDQLKDNIAVTTHLVNFIKSNYPNNDFGLEVEVGEIGKKDSSGMVLTSPEEAVIYLQELAKNGIKPHLLAIANGSTHGNIYKNGKLIPQVCINLDQTIKVAQAIKSAGFKTKIAQHGITGTPLGLIAKHFPKGDILKGNVGVFWRNLTWEVLKKLEPKLFSRIWNWTLEKYADRTKSDEEIFGKQSKFAIKEFFTEIYHLDSKTIEVLKNQAYLEAVKFFRAFNSLDSAHLR